MSYIRDLTVIVIIAQWPSNDPLYGLLMCYTWQCLLWWFNPVLIPSPSVECRDYWLLIRLAWPQSTWLCQETPTNKLRKTWDTWSMKYNLPKRCNSSVFAVKLYCFCTYSLRLSDAIHKASQNLVNISLGNGLLPVWQQAIHLLIQWWLLSWE